MSKRALTIVLATLMAVGIYSAVANGGVEGDFKFHISFYPQTTSYEVDKLGFDFEGFLDLNILISGITFGNKLAMGIAGLEHYIASLTTTLGALDLKDEFWFAAPFASATSYGIATYERIGDLRFVKKRVTATLTIGGLEMKSLILFEDVKDKFPYDVGTTEPPAQEFGFGAVITLSGTTVSGIGVKSVTGICADDQKVNKIKKYSAPGVVNPACVQAQAAEGKTPLWFEVEKLYITGISIAGLTIDSYTEFRPSEEITQTLTIKTTLLGFDVSAVFSSTDITQLIFSSATWTIAMDPYFTLKYVDANGDLIVNAGETISISGSLPVQGATFAPAATLTAGTGITAASVTGTFPVAIGTLTAKLTYGGTPLAWSTFYFKLATDVAGLGLDIASTFGVSGLSSGYVDIKIPFSL